MPTQTGLQSYAVKTESWSELQAKLDMGVLDVAGNSVKQSAYDGHVRSIPSMCAKLGALLPSKC